MRYLLVLILALSGCREKITFVENGAVFEKTIEVEERKVEVEFGTLGDLQQGTQSCSHPGFCMNCGLKFSGKFECGVGFYFACPGSQPITFRPRVNKVRTRYTDDKGRVYLSPFSDQQDRVIESSGGCQ